MKSKGHLVCQSDRFIARLIDDEQHRVDDDADDIHCADREEEQSHQPNNYPFLYLIIPETAHNNDIEYTDDQLQNAVPDCNGVDGVDQRTVEIDIG